ncbi:hypothetical protein ACFU8R_16715 [Pseudonocardia alni]|uniref:hypothetical protein n=1 Tax=Pseudonocardia alni TaxID=33907 RepID=UPI0036C66025
MSFEPATRWVLHGDGEVGADRQCHRYYVVAIDPEDDLAATVWVPGLFDLCALTLDDLPGLRGAGWLVLRDGRVLCDRHVGGLAELARAAVEGLPFDDPSGAEGGAPW